MAEQNKKSFEKNQIGPAAVAKQVSLFDEAITDLKDKIKSLHETDSGDFKRKALLYLNRLEPSHIVEQGLKQKNRQAKMSPSGHKTASKGREERQKIETLKQEILCREHPSHNEMENVESLRAFILESLHRF